MLLFSLAYLLCISTPLQISISADTTEFNEEDESCDSLSPHNHQETFD